MKTTHEDIMDYLGVALLVFITIVLSFLARGIALNRIEEATSPGLKEIIGGLIFMAGQITQSVCSRLRSKYSQSKNEDTKKPTQETI